LASTILPVSVTVREEVDITKPEILAKWISNVKPQDCCIESIKRGGSKGQILVWGASVRDYALLINKDNWKEDVLPWLPERNTINQSAVIIGVNLEISEETISEALHTESLKFAMVKRLKRSQEGNL
jgi:hypothetical protein